MSKSWKSGNADRKDKELSKVQRLAHENKKLKTEIARFRKALNRIESGWCPGCLKEHANPEDSFEESNDSPTKVVRKDRECFKCKEGQLRIFKYHKIGEAWYYRKCNNEHCKHRTVGKRYTPEVQD